MKPEIQQILTNREVIAVDQDKLGHQGRRVRKGGDLEVWARPLEGGNRAAVLLNRGTTPQSITANWSDLDYPGHMSATVRDLWQHKDLGQFRESFSAQVPPHSVVMITVTP
jgi:alpha-galactosidase